MVKKIIESVLFFLKALFLTALSCSFFLLVVIIFKTIEKLIVMVAT